MPINSKVRRRESVGSARAGAIAALPLAAAVGTYVAVFGVLAREAGLSVGELAAMNALVFAATSQFAAIQVWSPAAVPILKLALVVMVVNLRYLIITASLRTVLTGSLWQRLVGAHFIVDENWALTMARPPAMRNASFLLGSGITIFAVGNLGGLVGFAIGESIPDPRTLGLDFAPVAAFAALALGMWRHAGLDFLPWTAAAVGASAASHWLPDGAQVVMGTAAGLAAGLVTNLRRNADA